MKNSPLVNLVFFACEDNRMDLLSSILLKSNETTLAIESYVFFIHSKVLHVFLTYVSH